jgi:hypothetical protein
MYIIRIEHEVTDYEKWKTYFYSDPLERVKSGVLNYRLLQPVDDKNLIFIDLDFGDQNQAKLFLAKLQVLWGKMEGDLIKNPKAGIVRIVEENKSGKI